FVGCEFVGIVEVRQRGHSHLVGFSVGVEHAERDHLGVRCLVGKECVVNGGWERGPAVRAGGSVVVRSGRRGWVNSADAGRGCDGAWEGWAWVVLDRTWEVSSGGDARAGTA